MKENRVLVVATSHKTRGGITSVVNAHRKGKQWNEFHCKWIETHIDKNIILKLLYFLRSLVVFSFLIPFYDLVHIHLSEPPSAIRKLMFLVIAKMWRKKVILHFHAFSPETTVLGKYNFLYRYIFEKTDFLIVLSNSWKLSVDRAFHLGEKIKVVYNPCPEVNFEPEYKKEKFILFAGTVNKRKGYVDMIKSFSYIASKYRDWKIVFAGNGDIDNGREMAVKYNIDSQTIFLGWVDGIEKDKIFKKSMIFCLPSYAEGFPMAVLDAWAYGLPVITTPVGGIPDIAEDNKNLLLFKAGDVKALSDNMERLIVDDKLRNYISNRSVLLSKTIFNIGTVNNEIRSLYLDLLSK